MREVSIMIDDYSDTRVFTVRKLVSPAALEAANYPGEILLHLYNLAKEEIDERCSEELEEARKVAEERKLEGS